MAEFWSNNDRGYRLRLWVDQVSQNVSNNTSQVRIRLALLNTTTTFSDYACSAYVDFDGGRRINWSGSPSMLGYNQTAWLIDETHTIHHTADGSKRFGIMASFSGSGGYSPGTLTVGGAVFTLSSIPRASSVSVGTGMIGSSLDIRINRKSDSFKHTIRYVWGNRAGTIATNVDTSHTWAIPMDFANDLPDAVTGSGTITVETYSGASKIGEQAATFTAAVPETVRPTFTGFTLTDANSITAAIVPGGEHFIQNLSDIRVHFGQTTGALGSTIAGYRAEIVGLGQSTVSNAGSLGVVKTAGEVTVRASVTDSRGRMSNTIDRTVHVLPYHAPVLKFGVTRSGMVSSTLTINRNAQIAPLSVNNSQKNKMTLSFKVAPLGSTTYTTDTGPASGSWTSISNLTNSNANLAGVYAANQSWIILGVLEDRLTRTEFSVAVGTESVVLSYDRSGVGINKVRERGALDVKGDIYANDRIIQMHALTQKSGVAIYSYGKSFDDERTAGVYFKNGSETSNPTRGYGWLAVTASSNEALQLFYPSNGAAEHFKRVYYAGRWSEWSQGAAASHPNLTRTDWTSTGVSGVHYKRQGDTVTLRLDTKGGGGNLFIGSIPQSLLPLKGKGSMLTVTGWSVAASGDKHLQVNASGEMYILDAGSTTFSTQVSWSI